GVRRAREDEQPGFRFSHVASMTTLFAIVLHAVHHRHARSDFPSQPIASRLHGMPSLHLRHAQRALPVGIAWPNPAAGRPGIGVLFAGDLSTAATEPVARVLRDGAGLLLVTAHSSRTPQDALTTAEWVADHGAELGADPARLVVAGIGCGAALA